MKQVQTLSQQENLIKESLSEILLSRKFHIKQSMSNVFGKVVKLFYYDEDKKEYISETHELQSWYISLPCNEKTDVQTLIDCFKHLVFDFEYKKEKGLDNTDDYTCHQLCDWEWFESEEGHIIQNCGQITLVKYAIILKDIKEI